MKKPLLVLCFLLLLGVVHSFTIKYRVVTDGKYSTPKTEIIAAESQSEAKKAFLAEHSDEQVSILSCD